MKTSGQVIFVYEGLVDEIADVIERRRMVFWDRESPELSFTYGFGQRYDHDPVRKAVYKAEVHDELMSRKLRIKRKRLEPDLIPLPDPRAHLRIVRRPGFPPKPKERKKDSNYSLDLNPPPGAA